MLHGLLIRKPHLDRILAGEKTWEIRGSATSRRGPIALIQSGSGTVVGTCELVDCVGPLTLEQLNANSARAGLGQVSRLFYRRTFAWVLRGARRLAEPVPYVHPAGAVIWVRLAPEVEVHVMEQLDVHRGT
jgi:hypothetical protein